MKATVNYRLRYRRPGIIGLALVLSVCLGWALCESHCDPPVSNFVASRRPLGTSPYRPFFCLVLLFPYSLMAFPSQPWTQHFPELFRGRPNPREALRAKFAIHRFFIRSLRRLSSCPLILGDSVKPNSILRYPLGLFGEEIESLSIYLPTIYIPSTIHSVIRVPTYPSTHTPIHPLTNSPSSSTYLLPTHLSFYPSLHTSFNLPVIYALIHLFFYLSVHPSDC